MTHKEFVPYAEALALKELHFDEPCFGIHYNEGLNPSFMIATQYGEHGAAANGGILAPLYQQAFRFFREEHLLSCEITGFYVSSNYGFDVSIVNLTDFLVEFRAGLVENYREAELKCLEKLIEIVGQKNKNYVE